MTLAEYENLARKGLHICIAHGALVTDTEHTPNGYDPLPCAVCWGGWRRDAYADPLRPRGRDGRLLRVTSKGYQRHKARFVALLRIATGYALLQQSTGMSVDDAYAAYPYAAMDYQRVDRTDRALQDA